MKSESLSSEEVQALLQALGESNELDENDPLCRSFSEDIALLRNAVQFESALTDDMVADIFTKALPRDKLGKFREYMLNLDRHGYTMGALSGNARRIWKQLRSVV